LAAAGDGERVGGDIVRDGGAGGDVGAIADADRGDEDGIAADEDAVADLGVIFGDAVVVTSDGAGADVRVAADGGVAEIGEVHGFRAFVQDGVFHFDEIAEVGSGADIGAGAKAGEGADARMGAEAAGVENGVGEDGGVVIEAGIVEDAAGFDFAAGADARLAEKLDARLDDGVLTGGDFGIDDNCFGKINGDACVHELGGFAGAEDAIDLSEACARIAAENFAGVGGDLREDAFVAGAEERDGVGEVKLVMSVRGPERGEAGPEFFKREAINAGIHFADGALLGRGGFFFDDGLDAAFGIADDAAVVGRVVELGGEDGGGGFSAAVCVEERGEGGGAEQGGIAGDDEREFCAAANGTAGDLEGVACAALRLLEDSLGGEGGDERGDVVCLVADYG